MKKETYEKKDGTQGTKYKLEDGDEFIPQYDKPRESTFGKYTNYSIQVEHEGETKFLTLTKGQAEKIKEMGDVKGKKLKAYNYENQHGTFQSVKEVEA